VSYTRRRLSLQDDEGPITRPSEVDDSIIVGEVTPTRVECSALPADSPWKRPGQVCAPSPVAEFFSDLYDKLRSLAPSGGAVEPTPAPTPGATSPRSLLALAAIGGLGYYLLKRR
jgi:hypothetical protein